MTQVEPTMLDHLTRNTLTTLLSMDEMAQLMESPCFSCEKFSGGMAVAAGIHYEQRRIVRTQEPGINGLPDLAENLPHYMATEAFMLTVSRAAIAESGPCEPTECQQDTVIDEWLATHAPATEL